MIKRNLIKQAVPSDGGEYITTVSAATTASSFISMILR